nr:glycosyltransferase family 4 protein [Dehalococcoidales bacterium]
VVHLTFEGIQTFGGGVATVTRGHLSTLPRMREELSREGISLTPYFCEIAYAPDHERRDPQYQQLAEAAISRMGGRFEYLINYTEGYLPKAPWGVGDLGSMENWKVACASGATAALNFARQHELTIVYCHDSLYALAPLYITLQAQAVGTDVHTIYVMHSTALTHEMPLPNPERLMVESTGVHWSKVTPKARLGYISQFMAHHIVEDYGAKQSQLVPTGNGVDPSQPFLRQRSREEILAKLDQYGIPTDKPLVFSWGRAVEYKRFDLVLEAAARLKGRIHPVVMVTPTWQKLIDLDRDLGTNANLIFAFDPELVACLLQWEKTAVAASLALNEPGGLTPMEVRVLAREGGALMLVSNTGGLADQVTDGVDGFVARQDDVEDTARKLEQILALSDDQRAQVRRNGLDTVLRQYTWASQILRTLASMVPEVAKVEDGVRDRLVRDALSQLKAA